MEWRVAPASRGAASPTMPRLAAAQFCDRVQKRLTDCGARSIDVPRLGRLRTMELARAVARHVTDLLDVRIKNAVLGRRYFDAAAMLRLLDAAPDIADRVAAGWVVGL